VIYVVVPPDKLRSRVDAWGLVQSSWEKTTKEVPSTSNAAETIATKPVFRAALLIGNVPPAGPR